jgi:hypothetical protein
MTFDLNFLMKVGPVAAGLLIALLYWAYRATKQKKTSLEDFFVVGMTGSSFPSGFLFIASAFDPTLLTRVSEAPVYIALAGCAVLYIALKTVREKSVA